jgi:hypothetical protein
MKHAQRIKAKMRILLITQLLKINLPEGKMFPENVGHSPQGGSWIPRWEPLFGEADETTVRLSGRQIQ